MVLTQEQRLIRDMAYDFAQEQLLPYSEQWDRESTFPVEKVQQMGELGLLGMLVPESYGGVGTDHVAYALALEEVAAGNGAMSTVMSVHNSVACMPICHFGSKQQKQTYLPAMANGELLGAFCLSEPQAGSDAASLTCKAEKQGDNYILNGVKQFVTSGKNADIAIVFAVTDASAGKKGLSAFIVPTKTPGYIVSGIEDKMGQHASDTAQITLENLTLSSEHLLGEEGQGYKIALSNLEGGRIGIAAQCVGMARAAFHAAVDYANERTTFGKPIIEHQAIAFRLADMATQIDAARLMIHRAALLRDEGEHCLTEASMAKLFASEMAEKVCSQAIHIHGGYGYLKDFPVERIYRDVRVAQIYEGTSDVQRIIIARSLQNK